ncbi:type VI secretion system membrane subunit TssM [Novosphingobium sp. ERN07]|uniref:type VI secretion system membrane subunit TssM n=1 Tax=Novosphingobium sp. ERN07 TaxID=2726187 RepID=UPI001456817C|nr:type VI secretion system membrane subunit TssM [Novosphingobium sp. ERN07]
MKKFFGNWWVLSGLVVLFLVLVFCIGLPIFVRMLSPWWVRLLLLAVIVVPWCVLGWQRVRKARKAAAAIAAELSAPAPGDAEGQAVAARMAEALASLRSGSGNRRDYLYNRPWYVIIGPPGAGKTTALLNSGLRFPLSDQSFKGVGGTRNLDFWFADEAVMVDTAGRYTTQDSDQAADAKGWTSFLSLMKRHRPLSPVNGVIVAIGVDELLQADRAGLDRHAALVRRRLTEVRSTLEVSVPVYLLLTKADLIAGFSEFYDDLDVEGRRAVLGATLPVEVKKPTSDDVVGAFDAVIAAQQARQAKRLFEEVDQARRSLILGFPAQLGALRNRMARFIDGAFLSGDQPAGTLRGFYFTSGVQQGAPLDRILAGVAESYQSATRASGGSGRTYFLNRVLTEVVFGEAGLVEADPAARRRQQARTTAGVIGVAAAAAVVVALWGVSFWQNRSFQSALGQSSAQAATLIQQTGVDLVEVRDTDPDLEQALITLRALRTLPQGYAEQAAGEPGLFKRFGLYQSSHADAAVEAYRAGLRRILLPRLLLRAEQYMAANSADPMAIYQPLKVYLMLGGQGPLDPGTVKSWVEGDWLNEQFPGADRAPVRKELSEHLAALLEDQGMSSDWAGRKAPLDGTAIASARAALQTLSLADRAYAVLRQKALAGVEQPWRASAAISAGDAQAFANGAEVMLLEVPYFYTREGYEKAYLPGLVTVAGDLQKDLWVLGEGAETAGVQAQVEQIRPGVAALYARDYIEAWERVATLPTPGNLFGDPAVLGAFAKSPSPLKVLLIELRKNTSFAGGAKALGDMANAKIESSRFGKLAQAAAASAAGPQVDAATAITSHFKPVHDYVGDGKAPAPIDDFVGAIKKAGEAINSAKLAGGGMGADAVQSQMAMALGAVATSAGGAPPQLQNFVAAATSGGSTATTAAAQGALSDAYAQSVFPDCQLATQDRYPFVGTAVADASLADVQRIFGLGGTLDSFIQGRIVPLLDLTGPVWRWNAQSPQTATLNPSTPEEFVKARQLRDILAGGLNVKVEAKAFGAGVDAVEMVVGNTRYNFERGSLGTQKPLAWSPQGNLPVASVALMSGGAKVGGVETEGPWALFRLMDAARKENAGPLAVLATFGSGAQTAVFKISLPNDRNPFGRGGLWSFRCPTVL